jgi:hypothetical protein
MPYSSAFSTASYSSEPVSAIKKANPRVHADGARLQAAVPTWRPQSVVSVREVDNLSLYAPVTMALHHAKVPRPPTKIKTPWVLGRSSPHRVVS